MKFPDTHQTVMPYLIINNAASFIVFTQKVFGATESIKIMRDEDTIMHAEIMIGSSTIMFADSNETYVSSPAGLFIYVEDADEVYKKAITEGATAVTALADQDYGRSGGVRDPFGNTWWITSVKN